jgi:hypothetical protein
MVIVAKLKLGSVYAKVRSRQSNSAVLRLVVGSLRCGRRAHALVDDALVLSKVDS